MTSAGRKAREGWTVSVRPSLCVGLSLFILLALAPSAGAALSTPVLTATNPVSPGASLSPLIKGRAEESETKVVTFGLARTSGLVPVTQDVEPDDTVRLYLASNCTGTVVGEDTVEVLEGEGISLNAPVAVDSITFFYAKISNEVPESSECSPQGLRYRQVTTPPGPPTFSSSIPVSPANQNFPNLVGNADSEAIVSIYNGASCGGGVVNSGSGAQFASGGIQVQVADNSESSFSAIATLAGFVSACSPAPFVFQEATPPPDPTPPGGGDNGGGGTPSATPPPAPRIRTVPGGTANNNTPRVTGTAPGATSVWIYATPNCGGPIVAKGPVAELAAGLAVKVVDNAVVTLSAVAVAGDNFSKCSDPVLYVEDSLTPRTRITMGPAAKTAKRKAVIRFTDTTGSTPGTTYICKVDKKKWTQCSSPLRLKKLKTRRYTVQVKASDPAGNVEAKGAKKSFKVIRRS